ncbi:hypothetical protein [Plectonema radiosum]|uniref:hypothetical protein n=1 Tax=Plectonema radiosum TaxID=945768 RepID=UPI001D15852D|nr:hypothetical protein [Plectonema radiosum]
MMNNGQDGIIHRLFESVEQLEELLNQLLNQCFHGQIFPKCHPKYKNDLSAKF